MTIQIFIFLNLFASYFLADRLTKNRKISANVVFLVSIFFGFAIGLICILFSRKVENKESNNAFLRIIRFPNLLIITLTQYFVRFTIIIPLLNVYNYKSLISEADFFLIVLSTVFIAAGGYIINDYNDLQIDLINKPSKVLIDKYFSKKICLNFYFGFSFIGIITGVYLSFSKNIFLIWQINIVSFVLLLIYSTVLKKIVFAGNFVISFLSALSIYLILIVEKDIWISFLQHRDNAIDSIPYLISAYSLFAFLISLIRELIKDIEDKEGDASFKRKTLPLVLGDKFSKLIISIFIFIVLFSLIFIQYKQQQWQDKISFGYVVACIELPLLILFVLILKAKKKKDYTVSSLLTKGIMLSGILSMLVFYLRYK